MSNFATGHGCIMTTILQKMVTVDKIFAYLDTHVERVQYSSNLLEILELECIALSSNAGRILGYLAKALHFLSVKYLTGLGHNLAVTTYVGVCDPCKISWFTRTSTSRSYSA